MSDYTSRDASMLIVSAVAGVNALGDHLDIAESSAREVSFYH